jgi:hypothetical protein
MDDAGGGNAEVRTKWDGYEPGGRELIRRCRKEARFSGAQGAAGGAGYLKYNGARVVEQTTMGCE